MAATNIIYQQTSTLTASGQSPVFGTGAKHVEVVIATTAVSGTTPTLDCQLQLQGEDGSWINVTPIVTTINSVNSVTAIMRCAAASQNSHHVLRLNYTLGGTTPSFTATVTVNARK